MDNKLSSYRGCLLGMAVGDAMGFPIDKKSWAEICEDYGPNGLLGYDLVNGTADITSYTQMTAFLCNSLLLAAIRGNPDLYPKYMAMGLREWAKSQQFRGAAEKTNCWVAQVPEMRRRHCMDTRILDALNRETLGTPEKPNFFSSNPTNITSAVAVSMIYDPERMNPRQIGALGAQAIAFTHGEPETFLAGAFVAYCLAGILRAPETSLLKQYETAMDAVRYQFGEDYLQVTPLLEKIRKAIALTKDPELTPLAAMTMLGCTTAAECVAGMVYATMIHPANFDEALIVSVNHSGNSCAVGALTGAVLGARLGEDALPEFYLESLEPVQVLQELAEDMTQARQITRIFDDSWDQKYSQGMPAH